VGLQHTGIHNMPNAMHKLLTQIALALLALVLTCPAFAERETVLKQIRLPHNYYFREMYLPQLTSGPSSLTWSPDGANLAFSMQGSLWVQSLGSTNARQLTAGPGYDYQPDWSPDGRYILFARYLDDAVEIYRLELESGSSEQLTSGGDVNLEPRWSPDGKRIAWVSTHDTGRFHVRVGEAGERPLTGNRLRPEHKSQQARYYYSEYDHDISPAWSPDGRQILYVSNTESAYGTGSLWRVALEPGAEPVRVRQEETSWRARPDWSPDGRRVTWSSYAGGQWHQLWITTSAGGGDPLPMSFGDFDVTGARWSPDGRWIAYISNKNGGLEIRLQEVIGGRVVRLEQQSREYLAPMGTLELQTTDENGDTLPARISVEGSDGRSYAPDDAWVHGDDAFDRARSSFESHYFHTAGQGSLRLPAGEAQVTVWRGLEHRIEHRSVMIEAGETSRLAVALRPLDLPPGWQAAWPSGDVHVHMNYGGHYRNTPSRMVAQAAAEDLDIVFNLIVNKEQRIPDIAYFSTDPDPASNANVALYHAQEFHSSYWGHLGLLGLGDHFLLPDFVAYPNTGWASPFPDNGTAADLAHRQGALVGYVHPYDHAPDPANDAHLTNGLPIDVALGKVDYYETSGFADYRETRDVWYRLLNCGFRVPAAGGTDAMANYASLRGPVGLNRVYVMTAPGDPAPAALRDRWLQGLKDGRTVATNGPLLGLEVEGHAPGSELSLMAGEHEIEVTGFLRSIVPVDHLQLVFNGEVLKDIDLDSERTSATFQARLPVDHSGWLLLRAWNEGASPFIFDRFPYATTSPVYVTVDGKPVRSAGDADYFIAWIDRVRHATVENDAYNTPEEKAAVLAHIDAARKVFEQRR
jgi:hypothetical protein